MLGRHALVFETLGHAAPELPAFLTLEPFSILTCNGQPAITTSLAHTGLDEIVPKNTRGEKGV